MIDFWASENKTKI